MDHVGAKVEKFVMGQRPAEELRDGATHCGPKPILRESNEADVSLAVPQIKRQRHQRLELVRIGAEVDE